MTVDPEWADPLQVPAYLFATAWLNVSRSVSTDVERITLCGVHIEAHNTHLRLVATDSYTLFRSAVPLDGDDTVEPGVDEVPTASVIAYDVDGRLKNLLSYVLKGQKDDPDAELTMWVGDFEPDENRPTLTPMLNRRGLIVTTESERLCIPVIEGEFPSWQGLAARPAKATRNVAFNPEYLGRFAGLKGCDGSPALMELAGVQGTVTVHVAGEPCVDGVIMPVRAGKDDE